MRSKPVTPYARLVGMIRAQWSAMMRQRRTPCMTFDAKDGVGYRLDQLKQRVEAAQQLGHDVMVRSTAQGLEFSYVQRVDDGDLGMIWNS